MTKPKLSATGGTAGQVLGTDGTNLVWQDDGLMLPYSSDGNSFPKFVSLHHFSEVSSMAKRSHRRLQNSGCGAVLEIDRDEGSFE